MDWLSALGADIVARARDFEFTAPRTVDQLMAWITFILFLAGLVIGAVRFVGKLIPVIRLQRPMLEMARIRKVLERLEEQGFFDARARNLLLLAAMRDAESEIGFVVIGLIAAYLLLGDPGLGLLCALLFIRVIRMAGRSAYYWRILDYMAKGKTSWLGALIEEAQRTERAGTIVEAEGTLPGAMRKSLGDLRTNLDFVKSRLAKLEAQEPNSAERPAQQAPADTKT